MAVHLLFYTYVEGMLEKREPHRAAHLAHVGAQREAGHISVAGPFAPPTGAVLVFEDLEREEIEAFVAADPYLEAGLITDWRVERWDRH